MDFSPHQKKSLDDGIDSCFSPPSDSTLKDNNNITHLCAFLPSPIES